MRRVVRAFAAVVAALAIVAVAAYGPARRAALARAGALMTSADASGPADLLTMDVESGLAGVLELADLYRERATPVALLVARPTALDAVARRRGVVVPHFTRDALQQLGVPPGAIREMGAGEGGTTETTGALAEWAASHPAQRVLVVVGASHGRRYRRALLRAWPRGAARPLVVVSPYGLFHAETWWQSRTTLREGLVELEKLLLDYAAHPLA